MTATTYTVQGMTCGHCVSTVKAAVGSVPGVTGVEVDLQAGTVTAAGTSTDSAVTEAISEAGYEVVSTEHEATVGRALPLADNAGGCRCG
ncbi:MULTISPECIES: heavy-metal-associated domain-containing protein [unclassified Rhodococcus (in: high G+C Gram-positive bacteria)]|uniref:heavy-metal-associated domain-containing protein n=1 Tax=unclassified Rhodococcus (in: high G+C Gram-positive bacteria) TaxID=192944 RepID=UPI00163B51C5|nr:MULTISPECIES: cation transporter [unclassified Rhodococcus (in: high G+C Gram-positive bacteria)]MBC2644867.1 heavy-metal-associated domain-containing protein [Rhodococcus sp. 3A]MBC2890869.1 heavy-metal-associated domain-containing protein [Rhodococcus sp. 4CII]